MGMDFDLKVLSNESIHSIIDHENWTIGGIKYGEVKNGPKEVRMLAKLFRPSFKLVRPFFLIFSEIVFAVENEFKLVIGIVVIPEDPAKGQIKVVQMPEIETGMCADLFAGFIGNAKGVVLQQIFNLNEINQVIQEGISETKLRLFQYIILV